MIEDSKEIWKPILGFDGIYEVSSKGRVKSMRRVFYRSNGLIMTIRGRYLKLGLGKNGYYIVGLRCPGERKTINVHRLVAQAFLNHIPDGTNRLVVDHINNIKTDNRIENLQVITNRANIIKNPRAGSTSKYVGVYWDKDAKKWGATIYIDGKNCRLGFFKVEIDASEAYQNKVKEIELN